MDTKCEAGYHAGGQVLFRRKDSAICLLFRQRQMHS